MNNYNNLVKGMTFFNDQTS